MPSNRDTPRVLIVDDDEGLLFLMADALQSDGYEVSTAQSGGDVIVQLARRLPDLMLLDLKLQDMDGPELLRRLKHRNLSIPFVVVTGRGDEKAAVESMREGALDYVMKDTGLLDLLPGVVRRALTNIERDRALASAQEDSRRLEKEVVAVSEKERHKIGADLHDGLGQQLTAIELFCAGLKEDMAGVSPDAAARLEQMGRMLREAIAQTRILARGLVPVRDDPDALRIALFELAEVIQSSGNMRCRFECETPVPIADPVVAGHLYRIAQEAVNNAVRHAKATEIVLRLSLEAGGPQLQVTDNGRGIAKADRAGTGMGLRMMSHRARVIGAVLSVASKRDGGVCVTCHFPSDT